MYLNQDNKLVGTKHIIHPSNSAVVMRHGAVHYDEQEVMYLNQDNKLVGTKHIIHPSDSAVVMRHGAVHYDEHGWSSHDRVTKHRTSKHCHGSARELLAGSNHLHVLACVSNSSRNSFQHSCMSLKTFTRDCQLISLQDNTHLSVDSTCEPSAGIHGHVDTYRDC